MSPELSIIIPCYNVENFIEHCLNSILNQHLDFGRYEVILVNDGSLDGTEAVIRKFIEKRKLFNFLLFSKQNEKQSIARNFALGKAKGKYIWFIDSDDYILPNTLPQLLEKAGSFNLDILWFDHNLVDENYRDLKKPMMDIKRDIDEGVHRGNFYFGNGFKQSCMPVMFLFSREFLLREQLTFIPGIYLEDIIFTSVAIDKAERMSFINLDVYRYLIRVTGSTMRDPLNYKKRLFDAIYVGSCLKNYSSSAASPRYFLHFATSIVAYKLREVAKSKDKNLPQTALDYSKSLGLFPLPVIGNLKLKGMALLLNKFPNLTLKIFKYL